MPIWAVKAWFWFRKNWKAVLLGVTTLGLGLLLGRAFKKRPEVVAPELVEHAEVSDKADKKAEEEIVVAQLERDTRLKEIDEEHADTIKNLTDEQKEKASELENDPDELNEFLLDVGKDVRNG
jgi:flagellar motility protein MotE (MotC chaperone)